MEHSESIAHLAAALSQFQGKVAAVPFDSINPFLKNKYASLGSMIETARPVLSECGLAVSQIVVSYDGLVGVETVLMHSSGEWLSNTAALPAHDEKGKSGAQVAGSIVTYLRRYGYAAVLGLYAEEDTDCNVPDQKRAQQSGRKPSAPHEEAEKQPAPSAQRKIMEPYALREFISKQASGYSDLCTPDKAKNLAIKWSNILRHNEATRHAVARWVLGMPADEAIESFKQLSIKSVDVLDRWLTSNPPTVREEAKLVVALLSTEPNSDEPTSDEHPQSEMDAFLGPRGDSDSSDAIEAIRGH